MMQQFHECEIFRVLLYNIAMQNKNAEPKCLLLDVFACMTSMIVECF